VAGSLHHARLAGVSSEVVGLVGVFCKVLVTRAFGDGVAVPLGAPPRLGRGVRANGRVFGYVVRARLLDLHSLSALGKIFLAE
jgi:hypothetical protein